MNKKFTLYVDQYGNKFTARSLKELREEIRGRVSIMYQDDKNGNTMKIGYVVGEHWLTAYRPLEIPVST